MIELIRAAFSAEPSTLLMSKKHCHTPNLSSIVYGNNKDGRLFRAFLAWPNHRLWTNTPGLNYAVGPHDHKYDIYLTKIIGDIHHDVYEICGDSLSNQFYQWSFKSGDTKESPVVNQIAYPVGLKRVERFPLGIDARYSRYSTVHDIYVPKGEPAAWFVRESTVGQEETNLFTTTPYVDTHGLYEPFKDYQEVLIHLLDFYELARKK